MSKVMVPPLSRETIETFAEKVRACFGLEDRLYIPILKVVEFIIPQIDDTFVFSVCDSSELPFEYAKYCPETNELIVRDDVYNLAYNGNPRHRFTISHEIGHYFLHQDVASFSRCTDKARIPAYRDAEWQANVFASAFLASPRLIYGMTASEVSEECGISMQAAEISLVNSKRG